MMDGAAKHLKRHYGGHHPEAEARWLGFDEAPPTTIYSNFEEFLADPEVELKKRQDLRNRLRGRPLEEPLLQPHIAGPNGSVKVKAMLGKQVKVLHQCLDNQVNVELFLGRAR